MGEKSKFLVFKLNNTVLAIRLEDTVRIFRAAEIFHLPGLPGSVSGVVNIHGRIIPVLNIRGKFSMPAREIELSDFFINVRTSGRDAVLLVEDVCDIVEYYEEDLASAYAMGHEVGHIEGLVKHKDGVLIIHNLDRFLSSEEEIQLEEVLCNADIG